MVIELETDADEHVDYIGNVIQQPYIQRWLAPVWDGHSGFIKMIDCLRDKAWRFFVPVHEDKPIGLIWGEEWSPKEWLTNVVFLRKYWGEPATTGSVEVEAIVAEQYPEVVGHIHPTNLLSMRFSKRLGYEHKGQVDLNGIIYNFVRRNIRGRDIE